MTGSDFAQSPMLPLLAQIPASILLALILIAALRYAEGVSARFVVFACWLRFMLSAFHDYTFDKILAGFSINALASASVFGLGLLLIRKPLLLSRALIPMYLLIAIVILSAVVNGEPKSSFETIVKFGYFVVIALHTYEALRGSNHRRFSIALLLGFAPLVLFQLLSVILNVYKITGADQSPNYIGGYDHEAAFSVALVALFIAAALARGISGGVRALLLLVALTGIVLANYRTAIIGTVPLVAYFVFVGIGRLFPQQLRTVVVTVAALGFVLVGTTAAVSLERFAELRTVASGEVEIIKPPHQFTPEDRELLTGRPYIWSNYYYEWRNEGGELQHLTGFGPDSWEGRFDRYAHNSFISYLFEYGLLGVAALTLLLSVGLLLSIQTRPGQRAELVAAHVSFILLNQATMPMWQIEGLILYAILWGFTMEGHYARVAGTAPPRAEPRLAPSGLIPS